MDLRKANDLKQELSASLLSKSKPSPTISIGASTKAAALHVASNLPSSVNGVGVGERQNGENFIKILTRDKPFLSPAVLSQFYGLGKEDLVVENVGRIEFKTPVDRHRPPFPGISIGHYKVTAGTLGCFVKDKRNSVYILSNNHVLANTNRSFWDDPILQPGALDGGSRRADVIGFLRYMIPLDFSGPNAMDAALAIVNEVPPIYEICKKGRITGTLDPVNNMKVEKWGRTTGHTIGAITTRNLDVQVDFDGETLEFLDQFEVRSRGGKFCDGGDSGSLIVERDTFKAVGLLFAGNDAGTTYASPIKSVLDTLSVKIL